MLPKIFENAKVGDEVFSVDNGWGTIDAVEEKNKYPIIVEFSSYGTDNFKLSGKRTELAKAPSCWPARLVPQYYLDLCPRPKRKVVKTIEKWVNAYKEGPRGIFSSEADARAAVVSSEAIATAVHLTGTYEVEE